MMPSALPPPCRRSGDIRPIVIDQGVTTGDRVSGGARRRRYRVAHVVMRLGLYRQREGAVEEAKEPHRQLELAVRPAIAVLRAMAAPFPKLRCVVIESGRDAGVVEDDLFDRHAKLPVIVPAEPEQ